MSKVTGLVLICSLLDGEDQAGDGVSDNIATVNAWLKERGFGPLKNVAPESGGSKHPQCCTLHCGYNYFEEDNFAAAVLAMEWGDPENLVLIMQPEDGATRVFHGPHFEDETIKSTLIASLSRD